MFVRWAVRQHVCVLNGLAALVKKWLTKSEEPSGAPRKWVPCVISDSGPSRLAECKVKLGQFLSGCDEGV
jgi:hypothetical protein